MNPAFEKTLGYSAAELTAKPFVAFVHPDDVAATIAETHKLAQGAPTLDFENRYRCRDGRYKWLNWRVQPAADGTLYAIARDVTERHELIQQLHDRELEARAANEAKSRFLAVMSHEIRNRRFNVVQQSARSLLDVVGDILDYSKIEAGKVELLAEPFSVRDLVARVVAGFSGSAESKGLQLAQQVAAEVAPAHVGDPQRLRQILANFVSNAIKFTEQGSVTVGVEAAPPALGTQRLVFHVVDTGIGMAPWQVERLFQPFTQADEATTRRFGGTGLGLSISRRLAELMGAVIDVDSAPGRGTTMHFTLTLPLGEAAALASQHEPEEAPPIGMRRSPSREEAEREGSLLLLAEDHPINRIVLAQQLELTGFVADIADTGQIALDRFGAARYALVFTDLHMPGLDGFQLVAAIREFERQNDRPRTPVIALTANVLKQEIERCFAAGMDDYLIKPVTVRQLVQKLQRWLPHLDWAAGSSDGVRATTEKPVIDRNALTQFAGVDAARAFQVLCQYRDATASDLAALEAALGRGLEDVVAIVHRMKGAALIVGAQEVAELTTLIEGAARRGDEAMVCQLTPSLKAAVARMEEYVRSGGGT